MLISIDVNSETPIYEQLKEQIIMGIASGALKPGEQLPSIRQLAEDLGVNLHTINKAYNQLKADGLLTVDRRKGAVVNFLAQKPTAQQKDELRRKLRPVLARAICFGLSEQEIEDLCVRTYNQIIGGNDE
ncbi:GntR family transcriptional regulator [candidate division KSB1 bacterium]|nr:MAG: GntR family transcriptional regulator [candidate division KSB1 bacterium]